jgi:PAS domain S-box-containing protein
VNAAPGEGDPVFRALLESAPDAMVIVDATGAIVLVNAQTERLFGHHRDSLLGTDIEQLLPERYRSRHREHRDHYFENPDTRPMGSGLQLFGLHREGHEFPVEISLAPLQTDAGVLVSSTVRDVTERNRDVEARMRLGAIVESSDDAIIGTTLDGRISSWNQGAERIFGHAADEVLDRPLSILTPPERAHEVPEILERLARGERIEHFETTRRRRDGEQIEVSLTVSPVRAPDDTIIGASMIARDITERRRADAQFRALLESAPDAMVIVDAEGRMVLVNAQTERLFGHPREHLIGEPVEILLPPRYRQVHVRHRHEYFSAPRVRAMGSGLELNGLHAEGREFPVEISLSPLETESGLLVSSTIRDVPERKAAGRALEASAARNRELAESLTARATELEAVNRELETFSYSVSHDLRGPLRALDGFSQALMLNYEDRPLDERGRDYLQRIRRASQKMGHLIDDLLELSRLSRVTMQPRPVNLSPLARGILEELAATEPERVVETVIADPLQVEGDPRLLEILLRNLLGNAWKFTSGRERARIELGEEIVDGTRACFVRDNGAGFDMAYADQLFGPFQRLHPEREFEGTGIGLATVQRIVARHGGWIRAQGEVDRGATFHFTL